MWIVFRIWGRERSTWRNWSFCVTFCLVVKCFVFALGCKFATVRDCPGTSQCRLRGHSDADHSSVSEIHMFSVTVLFLHQLRMRNLPLTTASLSSLTITTELMSGAYVWILRNKQCFPPKDFSQMSYAPLELVLPIHAWNSPMLSSIPMLSFYCQVIKVIQ